MSQILIISQRAEPMYRSNSPNLNGRPRHAPARVRRAVKVAALEQRAVGRRRLHLLTSQGEAATASFL